MLQRGQLPNTMTTPVVHVVESAFGGPYVNARQAIAGRQCNAIASCRSRRVELPG